jgi:hypothetical protein
MDNDYFKVIANCEGFEKAQEIFDNLKYIDYLDDEKVNNIMSFLNDKLLYGNSELLKLKQENDFLKITHFKLYKYILFLYKTIGVIIVTNIIYVIYYLFFK